MPAYQIHRLKEAPRQQFRWAPHTSGVMIVKPKDYQPGAVVEAASPYAVWIALRDTEEPLQVGDVLELEAAELPHLQVHRLRGSPLVRTGTRATCRSGSGRGTMKTNEHV